MVQGERTAKNGTTDRMFGHVGLRRALSERSKGGSRLGFEQSEEGEPAGSRLSADRQAAVNFTAWPQCTGPEVLAFSW